MQRKMSDTITTPATPAVEQTATPTAPATPAVDETKDPNWLSARLERERRSLLKQLGVENVDDAKAALEDLKKRRDSEKTETELLRTKLAEVEKQAARAVALDEVIAIKAKSEMAALTPEQREAVESIAGDDSALQLHSIEVLRATWKSAPAAEKPLPAPANTTASTASPSTTPAAVPDIVATYNELLKRNPMRAAHFYLQHVEEITKAKATGRGQ